MITSLQLEASQADLLARKMEISWTCGSGPWP